MSTDTYHDTSTDDLPVDKSFIVSEVASPKNYTLLLQKVWTNTQKYSRIILKILKDFSLFCYATILKITQKFKKPGQKTTLHFTDQEMYIDTDLPIQRAPVTRLLPSMHHIKKLWHAMDTKTKMVSFGVITFMILTPLLFALLSNKEPATPQQKEQTVVTVETTPQPPVTTPVPPVTTPKTILSRSLLQSDTVIDMIFLNNVRCGIEKNSITILSDENVKKYPLPEDAGNIVFATALEDLNMIFFITDSDKLYSFSPISTTYNLQEKSPKFDHKKIIQINTFMTYLYVLQEKTITRYTRIENGFDEGKDWLKKPFTFSTNSAIAISESIFTTTADGKVIRFTQGLQENFTQDATVQKADFIYTTEDAQYLWVIDTQNGTLFKLDKKDGKAVNSFIDENFKNAKSLVVDEKNNIAFTTSQNEILSFTLTN